MDNLHQGLRSLFEAGTAELGAYPRFVRLERGEATRDEALDLLRQLARTHLKSPRILAFLYAVAPPDDGDSVLHNLLEELGLEEEDGVSHPEMLKDVIRHAGLADELPRLEALAREDVRKIVTDPLLYGTLRDVGYAALVETVAFEYMLSRMASRMAKALRSILGLSDAGLAWFTHHSEVDIRHAEEGLDTLVRFADHYEIPVEDAYTVAELTLRENVFVQRYFGATAAEVGA